MQHMTMGLKSLNRFTSLLEMLDWPPGSYNLSPEAFIFYGGLSNAKHRILDTQKSI